jgi:hypothetical protein
MFPLPIHGVIVALLLITYPLFVMIAASISFVKTNKEKDNE